MEEGRNGNDKKWRNRNEIRDERIARGTTESSEEGKEENKSVTFVTRPRAIA